MPNATHATRLAAAVASGTCIRTDGLTLTLAYAELLPAPKRLRWCAIFPQHQGHVHELRYTRATHDARCFTFYHGPQLVAEIMPYAEQRELPHQEVRDALDRWRTLLARNGNAAEFAGFIKDATG